MARNFADNQSALDWLLDQGVNVNKTDSGTLDSGRPLAIGEYDYSLHVINQIAAAGDIHLLDHLVYRGADVTKSLALHAVSRCHDSTKSVPMLCHLLDQHHMGINVHTDTLRDFFHDAKDTGTPLCTAIYNKNLPIVRELIARGADVKTSGDSGCEPISKAIGESRDSDAECFLPAIKPLIEAGVDADHALSRAIGVLNVGAAKVCLECGADPVFALMEAWQQDAEIQIKDPEETPNDAKCAREFEQRSRDMVNLLGNWSKD